MVSHNQHRLLIRIEELEDLVVELKQQQSPNEFIELKQLLLQKQNENQVLNQKVEELRKVRFNAKNLFEGNELYTTFQRSIHERNETIAKLRQENAQVKNSSFIQKIQEPRQKVVQDYKEQSDMNEAVNRLLIQGSPNKVKGGHNTYTNGWINERDNWLVQKFPSEQKNQDQ